MHETSSLCPDPNLVLLRALQPSTDGTAWAALDTLVRTRVVPIVLGSRARGAPTAGELVQEVLLSVLDMGPEAFDTQKAGAVTFLVAVAKRRLQDWQRRHRLARHRSGSRGRRLFAVSLEEFLTAARGDQDRYLADPTATTESGLLASLDAESVLNRAPCDVASMLHMHHVLGVGTTEAAAQIGLAPRSAKRKVDAFTARMRRTVRAA